MMGMLTGHKDLREQLEKDTLRLLCSDLIPPAIRMQLSGQLADYRFSQDLNHVVYEEIAALGETPARRLKELLPARMTNRGFPEFEVNEFVGRREGVDDEIDKWFDGMLALIYWERTPGRRALGK